VRPCPGWPVRLAGSVAVRFGGRWAGRRRAPRPREAGCGPRRTGRPVVRPGRCEPCARLPRKRPPSRGSRREAPAAPAIPGAARRPGTLI